MLAFVSEIFSTLKTFLFVIAFVVLIVPILFWWRKVKKRKALSASEYFLDADTTGLTHEELQELNDEK